MGLLSAFGFGGGKLDLQLKGKQFTAGTELHGRAIFKAGKRQQEIKSITANLRVTTYKMEPGPNGPQRNSHVDTIVKDKQISGPFVSQAGGSYEYELAIPLPADLYNSDADVEYRVSLSADIDGEVDPGDGESFTVIGGRPFPKAVLPVGPPAPAQAFGPPAPAQAFGPPAPVQAFGPPAPAQAFGPPAPVQPASAPAGWPATSFATGAEVFAQWTDGSWQQARVLSANGQMIAVDWVDPRLGASTWVQSHQVQPAAAPAAPQVAPGHGQDPAQAHPGHAFAGQSFAGPPAPGQTFASQSFAAPAAPEQAFSGQAAPGNAQAWPQAPGQPMPGQPMMSMPILQTLPGIGARVMAQWLDGNWHPGSVVQVQGSMIGVDWEDPRLGASAWVQAHQVQAR